MITYNLDIKEAIDYLLLREYRKEFVSGEHPQGINFFEWLFRAKLISKEENDRIQSEIAGAEFED